MPIAGNEVKVDEKQWNLPRRQVMLTTLAIVVALFMATLNQTIVGIAMPRIIEDLGGFSRYTWVTTAFMLTSTVTLPIVGKLGDQWGRKWICTYGILIFVVGSMFCGFSQNMNQLIAARAFQGIGSGMIMATSLAVFGDLFPPEERGKYVGVVMAGIGMSSVVGPTLGGYITDHLSWHWVFYINIPISIPAMVLFLLFFPKISPATRIQKIDRSGMTALGIAVIPLMLGLSWGGSEYPWGSPQVIGTLSFSAFMLAVFILIESRAAEPFIPLNIFKTPIVSIAIVAGFLTGVGHMGSIPFVPLFFQGVLGKTATTSGTFLVPMMAGVTVGAAISGQAISRMGGQNYRNNGLFGLVIMAIGAFLLSQMTVNTSNGQAITNIAIFGFGLGITMPVFNLAVQNTVPYHIMGIAVTTAMFFRQIGGTLGLAVFGSLMASRFSSELTDNVSPEVTEALTPDGLSELAENPQALMGPDALERLQNQFSDMGSQGTDLFQQLMDTLRHALSAAITDLFLITFILVVIAFIATWFLKKPSLQGQESASPEALPAPPDYEKATGSPSTSSGSQP